MPSTHAAAAQTRTVPPGKPLISLSLEVVDTCGRLRQGSFNIIVL